MTTQLQNTVFKGVKVLLFSFLFCYILLRILLLDNLHDETATYMMYFYHGDFFGENIVWDANNHLLNSLIGYVLYRLFGDNMVVLRLPNFIAFIAYFFATVQLVKQFERPFLKTTGLIALNTVPFFMEYFGNARGYGISFGFFAWGMVYAFKHLKTFSLRSLLLCYLFLALATSANLTLLMVSVMMMVLLVIYPLLDKSAAEAPAQRRAWLLHILFLIGISPLVLFGFALKETGALYYGSLDGLWDVTGKTLSRYVLFIDHDWLMYVYLGIFVIFFANIIRILRNTKPPKWPQDPIVFLGALFFGCIFAVLVLAEVLKVNYPEDRTGFYFIFIFFLLALHLMERFTWGKWSQVLFLFFPISFATHLSLETSVFSPDDRMNQAFYDKVKAHLKPEYTMMTTGIMNWNWPYKESHKEEKASVAMFDNWNTTLTDIIIIKTPLLTNPDIPRLYDTIAYHEPSTYIAFKRKQPMIKVPLDSVAPISARGNLLHADIGSFASSDYYQKDLQLKISGHLKTSAPYNHLQLVVQSLDENEQQVRRWYYSFETVYQGQLIDDDFLLNFVIEDVMLEEKEIKVYLWNKSLHLIELSNASFTIAELKAPENESR